MEGEKTFLLEGLWKGDGQVTDKIPYVEELEIKKLKPTLYSISQKTSNDNIGPLHLEVGYFRIVNGSNVELVTAHPFGACEIAEGIIEDNKVTLKTKSISRTSSASEPHAVSFTRVYTLVDEKTLSYDMYLATSEHSDERHHLKATLKK
jgi:hypothetical protein